MTTVEASFPSHLHGIIPNTIDSSSLSIRRVLRGRRSAQEIRSVEAVTLGKRTLAEHVYTTVGGETLRLEIIPNTESMFGSKPMDENLFANVSKLLADRQRPYIPGVAEEEHLKTIHFFSKNWDRLRTVMYPFLIPGNIPPACFSEVVLDEENNHRADFIGLGPDGRAFIIEVGKRGKSSQVLGYIESFRKLFDDQVSASPLVAYYSFTEEGEKNVYIRPPFMPECQTTHKALDYLHKLATRETRP